MTGCCNDTLSLQYFIVLNVAVGGTNGFFPDTWTNAAYPKPWVNTSPTAPRLAFSHSSQIPHVVNDIGVS